jgi:hypothetical protein
MTRRLLLVLLFGTLLAGASSADEPKSDEKKAVSLFDGKTLDGWEVSDYAGHGEVEVLDGKIMLPRGESLTGINLTKKRFAEVMPKVDYEVTLEAMRVDGNDFFCGLTFEVNDDPCSLIVGGWGGSLVGLSSLNDADASENETTAFHSFEKNKWYRIRLRVKQDHIDAWIDDEHIVNVGIEDVRLSVRLEVESSRPFGIASWCTGSAVRNIQVRSL